MAEKRGDPAACTCLCLPQMLKGTPTLLLPVPQGLLRAISARDGLIQVVHAADISWVVYETERWPIVNQFFTSGKPKSSRRRAEREQDLCWCR